MEVLLISIILKDLVISSFVILPCIYIYIFYYYYYYYYYCPRRAFAQKTKSRGGTLVTRAYIKESTYS